MLGERPDQGYQPCLGVANLSCSSVLLVSASSVVYLFISLRASTPLGLSNLPLGGQDPFPL